MAVDTRSPRTVAEAGRVYRFGKELDGNTFLKRGWGEPERGFVWSEGKAGLVTLPALPGANVLAISLWGYVPNGAMAQDVLIFINGSLKGYFEAHEKAVIHVSHDNSADAENLELLFYIPSAKSPQQAENLPDKRRLGIALAVIQVASRGDSPVSA